ncbi:hypothetical protein EDB89DRAFT_1904161 [Lactarius sanguifluus]|nr:hypothetical protein EDB89DRAFT_1904161 [Lactarius sanguifluus]
MDYSSSPRTAELIKDLGLIPHPEGGFFVETDRQDVQTPSPYADGALRSLSTTIFYLLTADNPSGKIHMNKSILLVGTGVWKMSRLLDVDMKGPDLEPYRVPHHGSRRPRVPLGGSQVFERERGWRKCLRQIAKGCPEFLVHIKGEESYIAYNAALTSSVKARYYERGLMWPYGDNRDMPP